MPTVIVDGVTYHANVGASNVGVAVNTHGRPEILRTCLQHQTRHLPAGATLVVVDDASPQPVPTDILDGVSQVHRFNINVGVARAKNKALELLASNPRIEHFFLWDEDTWPTADGWEQAYIASPSNHLMYQFKDLAVGPKLNDFHVVYEDNKHVAYTGARGCLLYVTRKVLDTVGGMDPAFGRCLYEHLSWSDRIYNAGLSLHRYGDVQGSAQFVHSMDEWCEAPRSVPSKDRNEILERNKKLWLHSRNSSQYIEYRELEDVVLTCYFTGVQDSQRNSKWPTDYTKLDALTRSLNGKRLIVFHNQPEPPAIDGVEWVYQECRIDVYHQLWYSFREWLETNPVGRVWCVDATDVEMLRDPFPHMVDGVLYAGWEPNVVSCQWMLEQHTSQVYGDAIASNHSMLLNSGVLGGSWVDVLNFCREMNKTHERHHVEQLQGDLGPDMGAFNMVAQKFKNKLLTGPQVTNTFKSEKDNGIAWWKHK